jgi:hypothetical protein
VIAFTDSKLKNGFLLKRCCCPIKAESAAPSGLQLETKALASIQHSVRSTCTTFGASGLAGWTVVGQLLYNYPAEGTFSKMKAMVDGPLDVSESY